MTTAPILGVGDDKLPCGCPADKLTVRRRVSGIAASMIAVRQMTGFNLNEFDEKAVMWICGNCLKEIVDNAPFRSIRVSLVEL